MSPPGFSTPLFGRDALRTELAGLSERPCVTLVGPGGMGKTRLARTAWPDAVFVDLSRATTAAALCDAVARAVGVTLEGGGPPAPTLARLLAAQSAGVSSTHLVLDNFEQLEPAAADAVAVLLAAVPGLRARVTSRQALGIADETVVEVPALDTSAATALFLARGRAAGLALDVAPPSPDADALRRILGPLEGLPLAIELAAARLELLDLVELERLLSERFAALRDPSAPGARHGTLWQTIDWSWRLLSLPERTALAQSSVFQAPFGRADAEAVIRLGADGEEPAPDAPAVLDALQSLCRKHLLTASATRPVTFHLAESVRDFAARKLGTGDLAPIGDVERRHAAHFLTCAAALAPWAHGPRMREMLEGMRALLPELTHVARTGLPAERRAAVHAALAYLGTREAPRTQVALIDAALETEPQGPPTAAPHEWRLVGELLDARGMALRVLGRHDEALADYERAFALATTLGDRRLEGLCAGRIGALCHARGQYAEATLRLAHAEACLHAAGDRRNEAVMIGAQALLSLAAGDFPGAVDRCERALVLLSDVGDERQSGIVHGFLATTLAERGETVGALVHAERALAIHEAFGNLRPGAVMRGQRGIIAHVQGRLDEAEADLRQACGLFDALGDPRMGGSLRIYLGLLALDRGAPDAFEAAEALLAEGLVRTLSGGDRGFAGIARSSQAAPPALRGEIAATEDRLVGADAALSEAYGAQVRHLPAAYRALAGISAALRAVEAGQPPDAAAVAEARAQSDTLGGLPSFDLAIAVRLLRRRLRAFDAAATGWHVERQGRSIRCPDGTRVDLSRRVPLTRLVRSLLEARITRPGETVSRLALVAATWPDEPRLQPEAARNRLNVALSTLRGLGLAPLIETVEDGHRLAPGITVLAVDAPVEGTGVN